MKEVSKTSVWFSRLATKLTRLSGSPWAFVMVFIIVFIWVVTGPVFHFSDTWQLVINTGTTIITFLMVFIIQQSQNRDTAALQLKLNELIACDKSASNRLIEIEDLTPEELEVLKRFYVKLAALSKKEKDLHTSHSIDEAEEFHSQKHK
ncbi:MAG: low affinity iron permease family protein [Bacteroidota bacterium]